VACLQLAARGDEEMSIYSARVKLRNMTNKISFHVYQAIVSGIYIKGLQGFISSLEYELKNH
jgi:hypothetical protein